MPIPTFFFAKAEQHPRPCCVLEAYIHTSQAAFIGFETAGIRQ
jgi:hypothetical protein